MKDSEYSTKKIPFHSMSIQTSFYWQSAYEYPVTLPLYTIFVLSHLDNSHFIFHSCHSSSLLHLVSSILVRRDRGFKNEFINGKR